MSAGVGGKSVLLCALNAKYIHSSLALRYLKAYIQARENINIGIKEFTINESIHDTMADIYRLQPDVLGFSCYIWNIKSILEICADFKKVSPHTIIILGGPEVSYDTEQLLQDNHCIDYVVRGEGEQTLCELLPAVLEGKKTDYIKGICYRDGKEVFQNPNRELIANLDDIPFPYQGNLDEMADRIIYYESSRGCPFRCSYCLSSISKGIRYFSLDRVKSDLKILLRHQVREIKFVDRTFNCDENRAREIMNYITQQSGNVKIHLEMDAALLSEGMLDFLAQVPPGIFNLEIGVQSTYEPALEAVRRNFNWNKLSSNIKRLKSFRNFHLHLDLIAGLPTETYSDFARSFNMVYGLEPDVLQLGFLKMLKGADIRNEAQQYNYTYQTNPPYQILSSNKITYDEILSLLSIEAILSKYFNSGIMSSTIAYIIKHIYSGNSFEFYEEFASYWRGNHLLGLGHKREVLYQYLQAFMSDCHPDHSAISLELLKYDYLCSNHRQDLPKGFISNNPDSSYDIINVFSRDKDFIALYLNAMSEKSPREVRKYLRADFFQVDPRSFSLPKAPIPILFAYNPGGKGNARVFYLDNYPLNEPGM
ncbi:MAG: DUF4080 domain-containing protein [Syntrophomonas sp.]|nr:DUF4080 domain-containing protein [Syntrophomonas sp.]